jgi:hypothetical protein
MTKVLFPAFLLLTLCTFSLPAHAECPDDEDHEQTEVISEEGAKKCDRPRFNNCVTNECATAPGGVTKQCRNWCRKEAGC